MEIIDLMFPFQTGLFLLKLLTFSMCVHCTSKIIDFDCNL